MSRSPVAVLYDAAGNPVTTTQGTSITGASPAVMVGAVDASSFVRFLRVDGAGRLQSTVSPAVAPAASTPVTIAQPEAQLSINNNHDTIYIIPSGVTFYLQQVVAGAEGDPTEAGSKVEVYYRDAVTILHLVTRLYIVGQTLAITYGDVSQARNGTAMTGDGTNTQVVLRRTRQSGQSQEVDAVIRGYVL